MYINALGNQAGHTAGPAKGDQWTFGFSEYSGLTDSGVMTITQGTTSKDVAWNKNDSLQTLKNNINSVAAGLASADFTNSGGYDRLQITSGTSGAAGNLTFSDKTGNLVALLGFSQVSGSGTQAQFTLNGKTYGPQDSNTFSGVVKNLDITVGSLAAGQQVSLNVVDQSKNAQVGANAGDTINTYILDARSPALGLKDQSGNYLVDVSSASKASSGLGIVDTAQDRVLASDSHLGTLINRMTYTQGVNSSVKTNLDTAYENMTTIDFPSAYTTLQKNRVLQDSAAAMLAQANLIPLRVLQILGIIPGMG
ncbi:MAG: hypothetical protein HQK58_10530 [Deltaproteobacteria bacterium]|nr:hypothetical protein [Deltaproteobacteria bacterium]